jgi:hypothetical protein
MSRGAQREDIFQSDEDRRLFLETLGRAFRRETTMTLAWIGERRYRGAPGHVSCLLYRKESNQRQAEDESSENKWF